jgi:hypothetical protein
MVDVDMIIGTSEGGKYEVTDYWSTGEYSASNYSHLTNFDNFSGFYARN